ncbi:MAG: transglutaminase domain-containing protein [Eubacterium sp.]|nr:transglutaminase domain-containing protein [Eubacterium sp.]
MSDGFSNNCIRKRIGLVLLTVVLAFSLFACGDSQEADAAGTGTEAAAEVSASTGSDQSEAVSDTSGAGSEASAEVSASGSGTTADSITAGSEATADDITSGSETTADDIADGSEATAEVTSTESEATAAVSSAGKSSKELYSTGSDGGYTIPPFRDAKFDAGAAQSNGPASIDLSSCSEGYVGMRCDSDSKIKFQVVKDDVTYTYSVVNRTDQIFPLQMGNGHYVFKVMENIVDNKYAEIFKTETDVTIADPMDPYLRPNQYSNYTEQSESVKKARSFAESASGEDDFIHQVYDYVCKNIKYDKERAESVQSGYLPDPDKTMKEKKGICLDYACLAAAMLRSQGVPTQIIFGYVAPDDVYHAWNKFYTEEGGWTLVEFKVAGNAWNRIDLTFSANGADKKFIGDGSNYMEAYCY